MTEQLRHIVYVSRATGDSAVDLDDILAVSRRKNGPRGITGALSCDQSRYVQLLEAPAYGVRLTFTRILFDRRHEQVEVLTDANVEDRAFGEWAMADSQDEDDVIADRVRQTLPTTTRRLDGFLAPTGAPEKKRWYRNW